MPATARKQYDHRIRQAIVKTGDPDLLPKLAIPDSTRRSWLTRGVADVVTLDVRDAEVVELHAKVARLEKKNAILAAVVRLLVTLVRVTGTTLADARLPSAAAKRRVLRAIDDAGGAIGRDAALRILGLSPARVRGWSRRELLCTLEDAPPCPRSVPGRLTRDERSVIRDMVEADEYKHISLRSLALLEKRTAMAFASYGTWCRLVREHRWRRPRRRLYPAKPKVGIRATAANEWWHVDVTIIRLLDGTRTYLHAVVDNYSRRVLAWTLETRLCAEGTRKILHEARHVLADREAKVRVMTDGGSENLVIHQDDDLSAVAEHVVAQVDIVQSNSMVEALWSQLRHRWLYLHTLDSFGGLESLIRKYFIDHNSLIPRVELGGRTPDEAYRAQQLGLAERFRREHAEARVRRAEANREVSCGRCRPGQPGPPTPSADSVP
jgi:putative transposase